MITRLGILNCDEIKAALAQRHGQYPQMFAALFQSVAPQLQFSTFHAYRGELPLSMDAADAYLITGSAHGVNDGYPWIGQLAQFIRQAHQAQKKILGVCFGHQLIAKALGGEVSKAPQGWGVGIQENHLVCNKDWMQPHQQRFYLLASHQDQVMILPAGAQLLARSDFCPHYMMQIGNHFLSLQGHPEFTKAYSKDLMQSRIGIIAAEILAAGLHSLEREHEQQLMARWFANFLGLERLD